MATNDSRSEPREYEEGQTLPRGKSTIQDRIAAFAMLDTMKDATQAQKALRLSLVGFSNAEIAEMLRASPAVIRQALYEERKRGAPKKARKGS